MATSSSFSPSMAASSSSSMAASSSSSMAAFRSSLSLPSPSSSMTAFQFSPSSSSPPSPSMAVIHSSTSSFAPSPSLAAFHCSTSSFLMAAFHSSSSSSPSPPTPMATSSSSSPSTAAFHSSPTSLLAALHSSSPSPPMAMSSSSSLSSPMEASSSSTITTPPEKKILIECANSQITEVSLTVALQSEKLKKCIEGNNAIVEGLSRIPVPEVTKSVFDQAMKFCEMELKAVKLSATPKEKEEVSNFEINFSQELENLDTLYDLIQAANTLRINSLLDRTCQCVADIINGKTVKEVRELFNIENDYTPEEEDAIRREYTWLFEK